MQKKTILIASTLTVLLLAGVFFGCRKIRYLSEHIVARPDSTDVSIFIEPVEIEIQAGNPHYLFTPDICR